MDEKRIEIINNIKKKLIEIEHIILDSHINENCYSIDYEIITNKNIVVLSLKCFNENPNSLFDEICIYDNNNLLLEIQINKNYDSIKICEIVFSFFK